MIQPSVRAFIGGEWSVDHSADITGKPLAPRRKGRWLSCPLTWPAWTVDSPLGSSPRHPGLRGPQWTETEIKPGKAALLSGLALKAHCGLALRTGHGEGQGPGSKAWTRGGASGGTCRGRAWRGGTPFSKFVNSLSGRVHQGGEGREQSRGQQQRPRRFLSPVCGPDSVVLDAREPQPMRKAQLSAALGGEQL